MSDLQTLLAQREALDAEINARQRAAKAEGVAAVRALMASHSITLADLSPRGAKPGASKVAPKFRDAEGNTWTGRGTQPTWLARALAAGAALDSFRIV